MKKVLQVRKYAAGYEVRKELVSGDTFSTWKAAPISGGEDADDFSNQLNNSFERAKDFIMKSAYNREGDYIGNPLTAYRICKKRGIYPEKANPSSNVCSIGFCDKEKKWYGWSHRAMYGFGIGDTVKKGDCAYLPTNPDDLLNESLAFWVDDKEHTKVLRTEKNVPDPHGDREGIGVLVEYEFTRKKDGATLGTIHWEPYPEKWGKGEWEAKSLEDAKEMAIAFAEGVS
jgi:hypothetical protein